ncbi:MAG: replication-associated recombination protein A [Bifidobacteriaceae bacterium]|nr:replication-associated recombination protein A [Bifidobacteriaceae bacterium]
MFDTASLDPAGLPKASPTSPLAVRMRPRDLSEVAGQSHLLTPGAPLRRLVDGSEGRAAPTSVVLWGPPGTGKTTLAYLVARGSNRSFVELSGVSAGVKEIREVIATAKRALASGGPEMVLFIDEVHRFSKSQQDALLPAVENRWVTLIAATTENPSFSVISPLLSRSIMLTLHPLDDAELGLLIDRAVGDDRGLGGSVRLTAQARDQLIRLSGGDARRALTILEAAAGAVADSAGQDDDVADSEPGPGQAVIEPADVQRAIDVAAVRYDKDGDQHYDVISAFIKSVRGSDVDAALGYLARMIEAGEDPRFIARRIIILAAEDVGMADPQALPIAVAAAQAVQLIGLPEGRIPLAEAVVYLATAPKSNAAYLAIDAAIGDVRAGKIGMVPPHLRDAHYAGAGRLGHGEGYVYAHDEPYGIAGQQYAPDELAGRRYYTPTDRGYERQVAARLTKIHQLLDPNGQAGDAADG